MPLEIQQSGSALAIVLGTVLDGIPVDGDRSDHFRRGAVGAAYLAAVFISNLPESISSTTGLASGSWKKSRILWMWIGIALVSGLASWPGTACSRASPDTVAVVLAFAAGAILTMLANTMMPERLSMAGSWSGRHHARLRGRLRDPHLG